MVRRGSVLLILLCCVWSSVLVVPCMAQGSSNLGIFNATADWGLEPEFGPKVGEFKIPGIVEISGTGESTVYDLYGNGDLMWLNNDEAFLLYTRRSGSWSISAKCQILDKEEIHPAATAFMMIRNSSSAHSAHCAIQQRINGKTWVIYREKSSGHTESLGDIKNDDSNVLIEKGEDLYFRLTRIASENLILSEWSYDGVTWNYGKRMNIERYENPIYGLGVYNREDNNLLAHARFTDVKIEAANPIAKRFANASHFNRNSEYLIILEVENPSDSPVKVNIEENLPKGWIAREIVKDGTFTEGTIRWDITIKPGITTLKYKAVAPSQPTDIAHFGGTIGTFPTLGFYQLNPYYRISRETLINQTLVICIPAVLGILHLLLFIFIPKLRENLYYALCLLVLSIGIYVNITAWYSDQELKLILFKVCLSCYSVSLLFLTLFFYSICQRKIPKLFWFLLTFALLVYSSAFYEFLPTYFFRDIFITIIILSLECIRVFCMNWRTLPKGIWIVAFGAVIYALALGSMGVQWLFGVQYIRWIDEFGLNLSIFVFCSCVSYYLIKSFAATYNQFEQLNQELESRVKQRTLELEQANQELRVLDKMKTQFVSQASHDLRTPLTAIKGSLDNLLIGIAGALNEKQQKVMTRATTSVDRLTNLINDVLDLNRIETGRIVLEKSDIPFKSLVDNIINENQPAADQKRITLNANLGEEINLHIDGSKIERVVGELISNAIKYTPESGTIDISLSTDDQHISLSVKDSGIGMTAEECAKIWERFYRTSASKQFAKGSGLGLSIAKELVELHGGTIGLISEQGNGTTFTLTLPWHKE